MIYYIAQYEFNLFQLLKKQARSLELCQKESKMQNNEENSDDQETIEERQETTARIRDEDTNGEEKVIESTNGKATENQYSMELEVDGQEYNNDSGYDVQDEKIATEDGKDEKLKLKMKRMKRLQLT